jgi:hypothetical protein
MAFDEYSFDEMPPSLRKRLQSTRGIVYYLCMNPPIRLGSVELGYLNPLTHYVGFTQQTNPLRRVRAHGGKVLDQYVVALIPGSMWLEWYLQRYGNCKKCGRSLTKDASSLASEN